MTRNENDQNRQNTKQAHKVFKSLSINPTIKWSLLGLWGMRNFHCWYFRPQLVVFGSIQVMSNSWNSLGFLWFYILFFLLYHNISTLRMAQKLSTLFIFFLFFFQKKKKLTFSEWPNINYYTESLFIPNILIVILSLKKIGTSLYIRYIKFKWCNSEWIHWRSRS